MISSYYLLADLVLSHVPMTIGSKQQSVRDVKSGLRKEEEVPEGGVRIFDKMGVDRTQEVKSRKYRRQRNDSTVQTYSDSPVSY